MKASNTGTLTLTALVAPISMTSSPTFGVDELHSLQESVCFQIDTSKVPQNIRCSCLRGGPFCLLAEHWLLEFGPGSPFWLGKDGLPRAGSLIRYVGPKQGGKSVIIDENGERICCVEGHCKVDVDKTGSTVLTG